jgi:hypothetical protein
VDETRGEGTDIESMNPSRRFFDVRYLSFEGMAILVFNSGFRHAIALVRNTLGR